MKKLINRLSDAFTAKSETVTEAADRMANYIGKYYRHEERVLIVQSVEKRILADLITEREEHELKADECRKAINNLKRA